MGPNGGSVAMDSALVTKGVITHPTLPAVFHLYMFNDDIYLGLPTCFLRAVCVCMWRGGGGGVSHRMWLCPVWGGGVMSTLLQEVLSILQNLRLKNSKSCKNNYRKD